MLTYHVNMVGQLVTDLYISLSAIEHQPDYAQIATLSDIARVI